MSGIRVVMADDHAHVRAMLRAALEQGGCEVCGEGSSAEDAVRLAGECEPDVVLLDIHMPGNGIEAARHITAQLPQTAIVMLTSSREDEDLFEALRAGASGYLLKGSDPAELPGLLQDVLAGKAAMPATLMARVLEEFRAPKKTVLRRSAAADKLSAREREVMELLSKGMTTDEVAQKLFLSATTVRVHVSSVLKKLRVKDRDSAFRLLSDG
nr:response regulator transcription factor [uncultured Friedmanniella sp.]